MSEKIALITGAGSGIGRAAARALAAQGWTLVLVGRRFEPLAETAALLPAAAPAPLLHSADIADSAQVDALFAAVSARFGRLDLLFNNAGIGAPLVPFEELTAAQWRGVIDVNLNGLFYCAQAAYRLMKQQTPQGGRIINNGSVSAQVPRPRTAPYAASKHGVSGLTKTIALEGRAYNIACSQIDIGNAATDMAAPMTAGILQADGSIKVEPTIDVALVGDAVAQIAALPLSANVLFMTLMASAMPLVGRG